MVVGRVLFGHGHMHIVPTTSGSWRSPVWTRTHAHGSW